MEEGSFEPVYMPPWVCTPRTTLGTPRYCASGWLRGMATLKGAHCLSSHPPRKLRLWAHPRPTRAGGCPPRTPARDMLSLKPLPKGAPRAPLDTRSYRWAHLSGGPARVSDAAEPRAAARLPPLSSPFRRLRGSVGHVRIRTRIRTRAAGALWASDKVGYSGQTLPFLSESS